MKINTAFILCAGFGKRLNPLTLEKPKPLLQIKNQTILEDCIDIIIKLKVKNIFLNTFYLSEQISTYFKEKKFPGNPNSNLVPWMSVPNSFHIERQIIFGHWATLQGNYRTSKAHGIDTGYVWQGYLTAVRLDDRKIFMVRNDKC